MCWKEKKKKVNNIESEGKELNAFDSTVLMMEALPESDLREIES